MTLALVVAASLAGCAGTLPAPADDFTLATHVKIALLNDPLVAGLRIQAEASSGVVTLSGEVESPDQATRAREVARRVSGVRRVLSKMVVTRASSPS